MENLLKYVNILQRSKQMELEYDIVGRNLIVRVSEELDDHNAKCIAGGIDKLIRHHNIKNIIFDFKKTSFMDSSGIGVIFSKYKSIKNIGGNVVITNVDRSVERLLKLAGIYKIIHKYENMETALKVCR